MLAVLKILLYGLGKKKKKKCVGRLNSGGYLGIQHGNVSIFYHHDSNVYRILLPILRMCICAAYTSKKCKHAWRETGDMYIGI